MKDKSRIVTPLILNIGITAHALSVLLQSIDKGEVWRIVLASAGLICFFTFSILLFVRLRKKQTQHN